MLALLRNLSNLEAIQKAGQEKLRKLFFATGTKQAIERRIELLLKAVPITTNKATIETHARLCQCIVVQMELLNSAIKGYDTEIEEKVTKTRGLRHLQRSTWYRPQNHCSHDRFVW